MVTVLRRGVTLAVLASWAIGIAAARPGAEHDEWGTVQRPSAGPTRVIGGAANGCLAGAAELPPDGPGYEAIHLSRNRNYGHPATIGFIETLGKEARAAGLPDFYVGDMAQPRGGRMSSGHGSHQNGLDVDIWFSPAPREKLSFEEREHLLLPSMLLADHSAVDPHLFGETQISLLRLAARQPGVDRIFVNPVIKERLCALRSQGSTAAGDWLHKIRPWYGHDEHFHVRLHCPEGQPECRDQTPIPAGDGCDASLSWWLMPHPPSPVQPGLSRPPRPAPPVACEAVLKEPAREPEARLSTIPAASRQKQPD